MRDTLTEGRDVLQTLRAERPELYELLVRMAALMNAKGHDYRTDDPSGLGNLLECEKMGVPAWQGILIRMSDKWSRICTFARQQLLAVRDESIEDTLLDLANYALLGIVAYRRAQVVGGPKPPIRLGFCRPPSDPTVLTEPLENPGLRAAVPSPTERRTA